MKLARSILLVEDNSADIVITQRAAKECQLSADLVVARDGQEALEYLMQPHRPCRRAPDLILLDLNLPRLTGREFLRRIRATPSYRNVPIVVLSTSRHPEDIRDSYLAGANTYIQKPQEFDRFLEVFRTIQRYWLDTALLPSAPPEGPTPV